MDVREHWSGIKAKREELERTHGDVIYLMSIESKKKRVTGGTVTVAGPQIAAIMIEDETHRLATKQEIADWKKDQEARGNAIRMAASKKDSKVHIDMGSLLRDFADQQHHKPLIPPVGENASAPPALHNADGREDDTRL